jgi:glycerol-3-phosphate acyltransferase PlsY
MLLAGAVLLLSYLIGAIPFGWMIARARGVDIFQAGSGNIGATNVGRVLGRPFGILVFLLDFAKGVVPVAMASAMPEETRNVFGIPNILMVGSALCTFLGHLFPIYLGFRGGKGVATGAGTVFVLMPGPTSLALLTWLAVVAASRMVSLGSIVAVAMLCAAYLFTTPEPFSVERIALTLFCLGGSSLLVWKHRANIRRILAGTENKMEFKPMYGTLARGIHLLALGLWFGGMLMFNVSALKIFRTFPEVVANSPSDRTAMVPLKQEDPEKQKEFASALAGTAVGPIFPIYFGLQAVCASLAFITALAWWKRPGRVNRLRVWIIGTAGLLVAIGIPISLKVSALRVERFVSPEAKDAFGPWHLVSLALSLVVVILAGVALAIAAKLPTDQQPPHQAA